MDIIKMQYVNSALKYADKSQAVTNKHCAVCVVGGRVVSGGYNQPAAPHSFKVPEELH